MAKISQIIAREILNSKGIPTVEVKILLDNGIKEVSSCPSGTSLGKHEAIEIKDGDPLRFGGLGVTKAVNNIIKVISPKLIGTDIDRQTDIDKFLISLDTTPDKSHLGVNSILPVSMAVAKAGARNLNVSPFVYLRKYTSIQNHPFKIPTPAFNIINGGLHGGGNLDFQEFLVIPASSVPYPETLNMIFTIYQSLYRTLKEKGLSTLVGDEGGFGPSLSSPRDALMLINDALSNGKYRLNYDVFYGIDVASSSFFKNGRYVLKEKEAGISAEELIAVYAGLNEEFNLLYLEDPMSEDDWEGWENLNNSTSKSTLIVGDDLTVTNPMRLQKAISKKLISGIIIKPNQIGTVTESLAVSEIARAAGIKLIVSHRSGETNDDFIADFAVAIGADYVKFGAPVRGERTSKYNRLSEIYSEIKTS